MFEKDARVLVTGSTGMVGSAVCRLLTHQGFRNILAPNRKELDLSYKIDVHAYFLKHQPEYVLMIGAKVGGIAANASDQVGFLSENLRMQLNLFEACAAYRPKKALFFGSACIYPKVCPQPIKEESLMTGPLEPTNEGYAIAKIAGLKLAQYYHQQQKLLTICPMPCNLYGTNDHFDFHRSHVLSALVRRFVDAHHEKVPFLTLWGTGAARREFMHVDDAAAAVQFLMERYESSEIINVGTGEEVTIRELATMISKEVAYEGEIRWDSSKPDGTMRKCLDTSKIRLLGFQAHIPLQEGIRRTISEYRVLKQ